MLLYFLTWTLVALTPGPAVLCSMTQASRHGLRASLAGIAGIQAGNALFFLCIALGLATLLATATTAFTILRIAGAAYLFHLGIKIILGTFRRKTAVVSAEPAAPPDHRSLFTQGLLIQLTNPKALLFVSALLPQFIDPTRSAPPQLLALLAITLAVDTVVLGTYAFCAARASHTFRRSRLTAWLERACGTTLLIFGARLLTTKK